MVNIHSGDAPPSNATIRRGVRCNLKTTPRLATQLGYDPDRFLRGAKQQLLVIEVSQLQDQRPAHRRDTGQTQWDHCLG